MSKKLQVKRSRQNRHSVGGFFDVLDVPFVGVPGDVFEIFLSGLAQLGDHLRQHAVGPLHQLVGMFELGHLAAVHYQHPV